MHVSKTYQRMTCAVLALIASRDIRGKSMVMLKQ